MTTTCIKEPEARRQQPAWPAWALLAAYVALLVLDHLMVLPGSYAIPVIGGIVLSLSFVIALRRSGEADGNDVVAACIVLLVALLGFAFAMATTVTRGDREIGQEGYMSIAKTIRERPELRRFVIEPGADGMIDNAEEERFLQDVAAYDRAKALGR